MQRTMTTWLRSALMVALLVLPGWPPMVRIAFAQFGAAGPPGPTLPDPRPAGPETVPPPPGVLPTPEGVQPMVMDVRVEGNDTTKIERIRPSVRTRKGRPLDPRVVEEDVRRLHATRLFLDVRPVYKQVDGGVVLIFQVIERATLKYVKYVGNEKVKRVATLAKQSGIKKGDAVDPYAVEDARAKLEQWYHEKGHSKATVTIAEGNKPGDQGATFVIHEGPIQRVGKIVFEGNTVAPGGRLAQLIQTKKPILRIPKVFHGFKGFADKEKIGNDIDALTAYYRGLGYFQARIGRELIYDDDQQWVTVRYVIDEGMRYKVRNIAFLGNKIRTTEQLNKPLKLAGGDFFDQSKLNADVTAIEEQYGSRGYLFASIQPETRFLEQPGEVDLVYKIGEGAKCRIGPINVHITGDDPHTRRMAVLNRVSIRPGDIADIRQIRNSERRLKASGIFMSDPTQGDPPKIVFQAPEDEEGEEFAEKPKDRNRARGQSPDPPPRRPSHATRPLAAEGTTNRLAAAPPRQQPGHKVRFQDIGSTEMPSFDMNQAPPSYQAPRVPAYNTPSAPAYQAPAGGTVRPPNYQTPAPATPNPYGQPAQVAPSYQGGVIPNPRYLPSAPQTGVAPSYQSVPPIGTPNNGGGFASPNIASSPPQFAPPGGFNPYAPAGTVAQPTGQVVPGQLPAPQGYDSPAQLTPSDEKKWLDPPTVEVPLDVYVNEAQTGRLMLGVGVNSNAGLVGNVVLDEQNFDWRRWPRSFAEIRNATAFRGAGQHFRLEAMPGTQVQRYMFNFTEPYLLDTPVSLGLSAYFYNRIFTNWYEQRVGGQPTLGYQFAPDLSAAISFRAEDVNISNPTVPTPPELQAVVGNNTLLAPKVMLAHDTRDSPFLPTQGHRLMFAYTQAFGTFSFPRFDVEGSQYFLLRQRADGSGRHTLSVISAFGVTGSDTPIFENYFAGGFGTLRGFRFRGASPVASSNTDVIVGGRLQWVNTVEYMFPITASDALRAVAFCDFGTVEPNLQIKGSDFRVAPGLGLRISMPALGPAPIALDFAVPVLKAPNDHSQVFSFNVGVAR